MKSLQDKCECFVYKNLTSKPRYYEKGNLLIIKGCRE